jgi:undecaprenyl phosphate-alpha-L-ara4N flippase subunit ArnE
MMSPIGWSWLLFCTFSVVVGNVLLRVSIGQSGVTLFTSGIYGLPRELIDIFKQPLFFIAVAFYGAAMLSWLRVLATEPLSVAYPVLAALTFVVVTIAGVTLFAEPLGARKVGGLITIVMGLYLISSV